jgi:hypothetical protein
MTRRPLKIQCAAETKDGKRCQKHCKPGEFLCARHAPASAEAAKVTKDDLRAIASKLTRDPDPAIRLRAIDLLDKWESRDREARANKGIDLYADVVLRLTNDQKERLAVLLTEIAAIKAAAQTQPVQPEPERPSLALNSLRPVAPQVEPEPAAALAVQHDEDEPAAPAPKPKPAPPITPARAEYLGLIRVNNRWTHPLGDEHAQRLISGEIQPEPLTLAQELEQRRRMPKVISVEVEEVGPGEYRWTEDRNGPSVQPTLHGRPFNKDNNR